MRRRGSDITARGGEGNGPNAGNSAAAAQCPKSHRHHTASARIVSMVPMSTCRLPHRFDVCTIALSLVPRAVGIAAAAASRPPSPLGLRRRRRRCTSLRPSPPPCVPIPSFLLPCPRVPFVHCAGSANNEQRTVAQRAARTDCRARAEQTDRQPTEHSRPHTATADSNRNQRAGAAASTTTTKTQGEEDQMNADFG